MFWIIVIIIVVLMVSITQVNQYERGVKFQLGKFVGIVEPGWRIIIPVIQSIAKVDIRVKTVDVPYQEAITKDNVSAKINAVLYYKVVDSSKAVLEVENFMKAVSQLSQTTMRNVCGEMELDELLANREAAAEKIREIVDRTTDVWGIKVESVELKDVILPENMQRVIARQAEAERERRAVIINAEGEVAASKNLALAAKQLSESSGALHLRTLNTINELSSDKSNTVVFALPIEVLEAISRFGRK
jgi:regulator of protease activity HflC (stomatin/prohibitin superfamily)